MEDYKGYSGVSQPKSYSFGAMGIGEIIENSFKIYKDFFKTLFLIALISQSIGGIAGLFLNFLPRRHLYLSGPAFDVSSLLPNLIQLIFVFLLILTSVVIAIWGFGAGILATKEYIQGNRISVKEAYARTKSSIAPLIWGAIIFSVRVFFGLLLFIVPGVLAFLNNFLYQAAIVIEKISGSQGAAASRSIIKHSTAGYHHPRIYVLCAFLLICGLVLGVSGVIYIPSTIITLLISDGFTIKALLATMQSMPILFLNTLLSIIGQSLAAPIIFVILTLLYLDLKKKKESATITEGKNPTV